MKKLSFAFNLLAKNLCLEVAFGAPVPIRFHFTFGQRDFLPLGLSALILLLSHASLSLLLGWTVVVALDSSLRYEFTVPTHTLIILICSAVRLWISIALGLLIRGHMLVIFRVMSCGSGCRSAFMRWWAWWNDILWGLLMGHSDCLNLGMDASLERLRVIVLVLHVFGRVESRQVDFIIVV